MGTMSPTEGLMCPHGGRLPEQFGLKAKRVAVPASVWDYFVSMWDRQRSLLAASPNGICEAPTENGVDEKASTACELVPDG